MNSKIWIFPESLNLEDGSIWVEPPPALVSLVEKSSVISIGPYHNAFEPNLMGLDQSHVISTGPLIASAFKIEPPEKSVIFALELLSVDEKGNINAVDFINPFESETLSQHFARLGTRKLTPVWGEQNEHVLVWEGGSLDLACPDPASLIGKSWQSALPEGDGELALRTFIDDSINMLDGLELNRRREDEGKPKLNLLWPHSFGFLQTLTNLPIIRGFHSQYWSSQITIEGYTRLCGYKHSSRNNFLKGMLVNPAVAQDHYRHNGISILVDQSIGNFARVGRFEDARSILERYATSVWSDLVLRDLFKTVEMGAVLCPNRESNGLAFICKDSLNASKTVFDHRILMDAKLKHKPFHEVMENMLSGHVEPY